MKNIYLALMCMASLAIVTACGGGNAGKTSEGKVVTGDAEIDAKLEQAEKKLSEMTGEEQAEATIKKMYNLTTADLKPDFECKLGTTGTFPTMGNGVNVATLNFEKADESAITEEEFAAYVAKIYPIVEKVSPSGKIHRGPGMNMDRSAEEAQQVLPLSEAISYGQAVLCIPSDAEVNNGYKHFAAVLHSSDSSNNIVLSLY